MLVPAIKEQAFFGVVCCAADKILILVKPCNLIFKL